MQCLLNSSPQSHQLSYTIPTGFEVQMSLWHSTRYGSFIYIHRTYIQQLFVHQLISACTTGVGRAHNSWYASAQQLLCGRRYRLLRLITLILPATSKGYFEDYLHKTDATMIVLARNSDSTDKTQRRYREVAMIVLTRRKAACSAYCLTMAQCCPLPGQ